MMFARFKIRGTAVIGAIILAGTLSGCVDSYPSPSILSAPSVKMVAPPSDLDLEVESQTLIAERAGFPAKTMLTMKPSGKVQVAALAICHGYTIGKSDAEMNELLNAAGRITATYSTKVTAESLRINDSMIDLDNRVMIACSEVAKEAGYLAY